MATIHIILMILALACFLGAATGINSPRVNLIAAGLALWVFSLLIG
jgi:hypothetical protein